MSAAIPAAAAQGGDATEGIASWAISDFFWGLPIKFSQLSLEHKPLYSRLLLHDKCG